MPARAANAWGLAVDRRFLRRALVVAVVAAAVGMAGCGRKGPLDAPNAAVKPAPETSQPADTTTKTDGIAKPNKSFGLDPLLK
jgi:predicted small lipoprotein YifL